MGHYTRTEFETASIRRLLVAVIMAVSALSVNAGPQFRAVVKDTVCHASMEAMCQTAALFCRQFQACPDSLFEWAYVGLGDGEGEVVEKKKSKDSKNAIQLRYKDRTYDPVTKVGDVAIDIYVLGVRWWKDTHLGTVSTHTRTVQAPHKHTYHMKATYSASLLEGGNCVLKLTPIGPNEVHVHYEFDLTYGRMLATFISDKVWHDAIEWRFYVILDNLIEYAETGTVLPKK